MGFNFTMFNAASERAIFLIFDNHSEVSGHATGVVQDELFVAWLQYRCLSEVQRCMVQFEGRTTHIGGDVDENRRLLATNDAQLYRQLDFTCSIHADVESNVLLTECRHAPFGTITLNTAQRQMSRVWGHELVFGGEIARVAQIQRNGALLADMN